MKYFSPKAYALCMKWPYRFGYLLLLLVLTATPILAAGQEGEKPSAGTPSTTAPSSSTTAPPAPAPVAGTQTAPKPTGPTAIQASDIATKATEVTDLLRNLTDSLTQNNQIGDIEQSFSQAEKLASKDGEATLKLLKQQPALPTLQAEQQKWQQRQLTFSNWLTTLTARSKELQDALNQLTRLQSTWSLTLESAKKSNVPAASIQQIDQILVAIGKARTPVNAELSTVLDFQSKVGNAASESGAILANITQLQKKSMSGTFVQDSLPIWSTELWVITAYKLPEIIHNAAVNYKTGFSNYFGSSTQQLTLPAGFFLLFIFFFTLHLKACRLSTLRETLSPAISTLAHPVAAALTIVLLFATSPFWSDLPSTLRQTFQLIALTPMIVLIRPAVSVHLMPCLYTLGLLFALDTCRAIVYDKSFLGQIILTIESFVGAVVSIWYLRKLRFIFSKTSEGLRLRFLQAVTVIILLQMFTGGVTAALGYVRLSLLITPGVIALGVMALALYATLQIALGIIAITFELWPLRALGMVQHRRALLEKRLYYFLILAALTSLIARYLGYLGLLAPVLDFGTSLLEVRIQRGVISVTLGGILEFILTIYASYLLSAFLRFILSEDIYPRMKIPLGNSYAVSSLLHYVILAIGFTVAIAAIGVDLTKLTVLTGAFGIGLGFGLQAVVNNFVSGLILLFERPVHVGDTVEVGDLIGTVRRIGIRASTVHTFLGADIIVPNSQMVAEKVTNWTLTDNLRRIDLPVGVCYGAKPEEVIKLLENVAKANAGVIYYPAPQGLVVGYGDSSINYELRAWTDQFDNWVRIRSEIAIAVYHEVAAAGMSFPFPQREVRLLKDIDETDAKASGS
ncbi:mechanosensitive ion channel family protein [Desulfopila aestuarii]|uniref:Small-conductance mechanosensitive channel n=1 Tax=Desulfopila aestuarii DSM 18488 TaxID=1121416 RepID=A0A1M7YL25_9BACT|nr:mechanosensitive ion channel domain-containing protein [Desulfopila aestuarii]SHO53304.1 Small-conductance mechanosensitive channel [Desulfopila aestuarii DSM 18488]